MDDRVATKRFYDVVWPHHAIVRRVAQFMTADRADADDLAQETMLKAFRHLADLRADADPKPWLMAILRNTRIDRLRAGATRSRDVGLDDLPAEPEGRAAAEVSDWQELCDDPDVAMAEFSDGQVIEALGRLPEEMRWTLLLVDVEGMDLKEAADVLKTPLGTIKSRTSRARAMLRAALLPVARERRMVRE